MVVMLSTVTLLLMSEWYRVKLYAFELAELKEDYQAYIRLLRSKTLVKNDTGDDECVIACAQFVAVNRDRAYLRQSALAYAADQPGECDGKALELLYTPYEMAPEHVAAPKQAPKKGSAKKNKPVVSASKASTAPSLMSWPLPKGVFWVSSPFGPRKKADGSPGFHQGIDLAAVKGTSVSAAASGIVVEAGYSRGYGNSIVIMHNRKYKTRYAHLDKIYIKCGQKVARGHVIGSVGNTGRVRSFRGDGSHLHFEVSIFGKKVNPRRFLP